MAAKSFRYSSGSFRSRTDLIIRLVTRDQSTGGVEHGMRHASSSCVGGMKSRVRPVHRARLCTQCDSFRLFVPRWRYMLPSVSSATRAEPAVAPDHQDPVCPRDLGNVLLPIGTSDCSSHFDHAPTWCPFTIDVPDRVGSHGII